jgi:hypothetical protein
VLDLLAFCPLGVADAGAERLNGITGRRHCFARGEPGLGVLLPQWLRMVAVAGNGEG